MAGFYGDNFYNDSCFKNYQERVDNGVNNYMVDPKAALPTGVPQAFLNSRGTTPSWYGPKNTPLVHRESLMQGRNQPLTKCPDDDVIRNYGGTSGYTQPSCYRSDLEPSFDHTSRSCTSVVETDVWAYNAFPGVRYPKFISINDLACAFVNTQLPYEVPQQSPKDKGSYGSYGPTQVYI